MENQPASDSSVSPAPTLPRRVPVDAELARFSPASAPERDTIDSFCRASRPWALRQAKRTYRHLPESLREQAVDRAYADLRTRTPASTERRVLSAELADRMTEALRHVHVGWCLNESSALLRREGTEPVQPEVRRGDLAAFVDSGLGGLERAVLQLEIGTGRDTRSARAALRLHPRAYMQHREAGFSKLRDAISAQVIGRACDQHVSGVVNAATGDRAAMDELATGPQRCRFCAREAQGLRSVLHERLAVAPWPIAIKPAGLIAAKVGALGAIFGGKSAGVGAGAITAGAGSGSGASMAASVLAVAALATGTAAVVGHDVTPRERVAGHSASPTETTARPVSRPAGAKARSVSASATTAKKKAHSVKARRHAARRKNGGGASHTGATTPSATTPSTTAAGTTVASNGAGSGGGKESTGGTVGTVTKPVTDGVDTTVQQVTDQLPAPVASPVQDVVDGATDAVDDVTDAVDGVLSKP